MSTPPNPPPQWQPPQTPGRYGQPGPQQPYQGPSFGPPQQPGPIGQATPPPPPQSGKKRGVAFWVLIATVAALALVSCTAVLVSGVTRATNSSAVATSAKPSTASTGATTEPAEEPTEEPSDDPDPISYEPQKGDFEISLKVKKKSCYGSAGCNVYFRIKPVYTGTSPLPDDKTVEVTYKVTGGEDPLENSFTIENGEDLTYDSEEVLGISGSNAKRLKIKIISVDTY